MSKAILNFDDILIKRVHVTILNYRIEKLFFDKVSYNKKFLNTLMDTGLMNQYV